MPDIQPLIKKEQDEIRSIEIKLHEFPNGHVLLDGKRNYHQGRLSAFLELNEQQPITKIDTPDLRISFPENIPAPRPDTATKAKPRVTKQKPSDTVKSDKA